MCPSASSPRVIQNDAGEAGELLARLLAQRVDDQTAVGVARFEDLVELLQQPRPQLGFFLLRLFPGAFGIFGGLPCRLFLLQRLLPFRLGLSPGRLGFSPPLCLLRASCLACCCSSA